MVLDRAEARALHEGVGRELEDVGHHAEVGVELLDRVVSFGAAQRSELEDRKAAGFRRGSDRIDLRAGFLGCAEHAGHVVLAAEKRFQHGLAEVLLSDDGDSHDVLRGRVSRLSTRWAVQFRKQLRQYLPPSFRWSHATMRVGVKRSATRLGACFTTPARALSGASGPV